MSAKLLKAPTPSSIRIINFTKARIVPGFVGGWFLIVSGTKPCLNMTVRLSPLIYVRQPEYWGIEVIGSLSGFCLPATAPYTVSIPLGGITGTRGIEVIGANKRQKIIVPGAIRAGGGKQANSEKGGQEEVKELDSELPVRNKDIRAAHRVACFNECDSTVGSNRFS